MIRLLSVIKAKGVKTFKVKNYAQNLGKKRKEKEWTIPLDRRVTCSTGDQ